MEADRVEDLEIKESVKIRMTQLKSVALANRMKRDNHGDKANPFEWAEIF